MPFWPHMSEHRRGMALRVLIGRCVPKVAAAAGEEAETGGVAEGNPQHSSRLWMEAQDRSSG
jgi:hypothetical protein